MAEGTYRADGGAGSSPRVPAGRRRRRPRAFPLAVALIAAVAVAAPAEGGLQQRVAALAGRLTRAGGGRAGVSVVDLAAGKAVVGVRAGEPFIPASNQKLLTAAFAMARLGREFRFVTGAFVLDGNVILAGEYDPTLGDPRLADAAERSVYAALDRWAAGVRRAAGEAVGDVLVFCPAAAEGRHPDWPANQHYRWYAAPVGPLNFHNNCWDVTFVRSPSGGVRPVVAPRSRFVRVVDRLRGGRRNLWSLREQDGGTVLLLTGTAGRVGGDPVSVAAESPSLLLGRVFADRLGRAGVEVRGEVRRVAAAVDWSRATEAGRTATPLYVALWRSNKRSLNMAAEAVFLRAGDGTWAGSAELMTRTLTERFSLTAGSLRVADGSGLSRRNRVTPAALTCVLAHVAVRDDAAVLLHSLPIAGVDGTLRRRFRGGAAKGRVLAKTGYIYGVSCLSGYVLDTSSRPRYAFAVLVNDIRGGIAPAKALQEDVADLLIGAAEATTWPAD